MLRVGMTVESDGGAALARLRAGWHGGLSGLSALVLADCDRYVRDDTGRLRASARVASDLPNGRLAWRAPYARRVYYTGTPSQAHNALASLRWCERAKAAHAGAWRAYAAHMLGGV